MSARVFDTVTRLVSEFAEIDLELMAGAGQHPDIRTGTKDAI